MSKTISEQASFIKQVIAPKYFKQPIKDWVAYYQPAVYLIMHRETGMLYIGRTTQPLNRLYKHIIGNGSSTSWFINASNWKDFDYKIVLTTTIGQAVDLEQQLITQHGHNSYNVIGNKSKHLAKKPVTVNGVYYSSVASAAKELGVYPVKLYKKATISTNFDI